jgi:hypothetical protein
MRPDEVGRKTCDEQLLDADRFREPYPLQQTQVFGETLALPLRYRLLRYIHVKSRAPQQASYDGLTHVFLIVSIGNPCEAALTGEQCACSARH